MLVRDEHGPVKTRRFLAQLPCAQVLGAAKLDVHARHSLFDELGLQNQSTQFAASFDPLDVMNLLGQLHFFTHSQCTLEMAHDTTAHRDALANVQRGVVLTVKNIAPRRIWNRVDNRLADIRRKTHTAQQLINRFKQALLAKSLFTYTPKLKQQIGIAQSPVPRTDRQAMSCDDGV